MVPEINAILEKNEEVIWDGRQDLKSVLLTGAFSALLVFALALLIFKLVFGGGVGTCTINGQVAPISECQGVFQYFGWGLVALAVASPVVLFLNYLVTHYLITQKRVIIKSGFIGADMRSIDYDQMKSAFVNVGIIGKLFGTGTIMIDTGRMTSTKRGTKTVYDRLVNIRDPYAVYKLFQSKLSSRKESLYSGRADREASKSKEY